MKMENQAWKGFHGGEWQRSIDVRSFIQKNWPPYEGDGSFLTGPTRRTRAVWERCEDLLRQELRKGVLDVETHIVSGIDSFAPGYIDRENEVIVGLQTDAPLKRIVNLYARPTTRGSLTLTRSAPGRPATPACSPACRTPTAGGGSSGTTAGLPCTASTGWWRKKDGTWTPWTAPWTRSASACGRRSRSRSGPWRR